MNRSSLFVVLFVITACVSNPGASPATHRVLPTAPPDKQTGVQFIRQTTEQDLLWSAKQRFGEALVRRAFAASTYIFAKHYAGMLPPPPPNAGPDWRYPEPPVAVLIRENGRWLAATPDGFRQARSDKTADVERILADPIFWAEPE